MTEPVSDAKILTTVLKERQRRHTDGLKWLHILAEFAAIVFGVLLAFLLNEWRLSAREASAAELSHDAIKEELMANFEQLKISRNYHRDQYVAAQRRLLSDTAPALDYRGYAAPNLSRAALDAAIASGRFAQIEQAKARNYVRLNNELEDIEKTVATYRLSGTLRRDEDYEGFLRFVSYMFSDFLYSEDDAIYKIGETFDLEPENVWWIEKSEIDTQLKTQYASPGEMQTP